MERYWFSMMRRIGHLFSAKHDVGVFDLNKKLFDLNKL